MKRLLFISNLFPDDSEPYRGLDNVTVLHALGDQGWDIRVIAPRPWFPGLKSRRHFTARPQDSALEPQYLPVLYLPKIGGLANHHLMAAALRRRLPQIRRSFCWDVTLASWLFPDGWASWQAMQRSSGEPVVLLAQGSDVHRYLKSPRRSRAILESLAGTAGCITRSRSLATMLCAAGADAGKLHPIHNGTDTEVFRPDGEILGGDFIPHRAPVLLFVGNLLPVKDPVFLLQAFALASARLPGYPPHLVLAGKGPLLDCLKAMAFQTGISDRVHFVGAQTAPQVAAWMRRADALVMTSVNEGLPNVVIEAQACGLPVVATDVGGIHEVVNEAGKGRLTPPGNLDAWANAVVEVLTQPPSRAALAALGAGRSWSSAATAYEEVLTKAVNPASRSR